MSAPQKMLVLGDEEVESFSGVQKQLEEQYHLQINTNSQKWRKLSDCDVQLQQLMTSDTNIVWLWALTAYAWKKVIISRGKDKITVIGPNTEYSLSEIVQMMDRLVVLAKRINPNCQVFLIIPTIKNMYQYNQTRLKKRWGNRQLKFLKHHPTLNPLKMQTHAVRSFYEFMALREKIPVYRWTDKNVWVGQYTLTHDLHRGIYRHQGKTKMLKAYLRQESSSLKLSLVPDGFRINGEFLIKFFRQVRKSFNPPNSTDNSLSSRNSNDIVLSDDDNFLNEHQVPSERRCVWKPTQTPSQLQMEIYGMPSVSRDPISYMEIPKTQSFFNQPSTSTTLSIYEQQTNDSQQETILHHYPEFRTHPQPQERTYLTDLPSSLSRVNFDIPPPTVNTTLPKLVHSAGGLELVPTSSPSVEVLEAAMRGVYNQLIPMGTDPQIKKGVARMITKIALRENNMLPHMGQ